MPLVRLTGSYERETLKAAADDVHAALVSCLNVPKDDVFRIIDASPQGAIFADAQYLRVERQRPLFIEITLRAGRSDDAKRTFYRAVAELISKRGAIRAADLLVVLRENAAVDWSFGNGLAQGSPASASVQTR